MLYLCIGNQERLTGCWLKFTKTALAFCMSDLAALTTPRKFSTVDVAETNCSLPSMFVTTQHPYGHE